MLLLDQIELLRAQNRTRSRDSYPANECCGREFEMFHGVTTDQCASAT